jgi:hypothetical protein
VDLRGAYLGAACDTRFKELSDLRSVDFIVPSPKDWKSWRSQVEAGIKNLPQRERDAVLARLDYASSKSLGSIEAQAACIGTPLVGIQNSNHRLLYFEEQRTGVMETWSSLERQNQGQAWDETAFDQSLAADLLSRICSSPGLAQTLVYRAAREYGPGDEAFDIELARQLLPKLQNYQDCSSLRVFLEDQSEHGIDLARQIDWMVRRYNSTK